MMQSARPVSPIVAGSRYPTTHGCSHIAMAILWFLAPMLCVLPGLTLAQQQGEGLLRVEKVMIAPVGIRGSVEEFSFDVLHPDAGLVVEDLVPQPGVDGSRLDPTQGSVSRTGLRAPILSNKARCGKVR